MLPLKQKCSSPISLKIIGAMLIVSAVSSVMMIHQSNMILYLAAIVSCMFGSALFEDFYLTEEFIEKNQCKIIHSHLADVKQLLWWRIITDQYGDSVWISYSFIGKDNQQRLDDWINQTVESA